MILDHTPAFDEAMHLMQHGGPFSFITGRAGTGKSTLLRHFRQNTNLRAPVLAPTGVAALNVDGETIHRFFRFAPGITIKEARRKGAAVKNPEVYREVDLLVIDEISMVRADLLDCMDQFLRAARRQKSPFGGLRIVAIGDLYQLPPVVTSAERKAFADLYASPYFFSSQVAQELIAGGSLEFIELEKVYRQTDLSFVALLNAIRNRSVTEDDLQNLNERVQAVPRKDTITLTSMNAAADEINAVRLAELPGKVYSFRGEFRGDFPEREAPADPNLCLKKGARVMCVANDPAGRYVNGSLGWVRDIKNVEGVTDVLVELDSGKTIVIDSHTWTIYRSMYDRKTKTLDQERLGSFVQIPLRLAWAVTIHKSQGKTFDRVAVDLGRGAFAPGQTYVALSRCRTFEGLSLAQPVRLSDIRLDYAIVKFVTSLQYRLAEKGLSFDDKIECLRQAAEAKKCLTITYLKAKDEKSTRKITPRSIGMDSYAGHEFLALRAWCHTRQEERTFNVGRILTILED